MNLKLEDVAREAGVSTATVSRVINNHKVKDSTRKLVEDVIARLEYRPNMIARELVKGKSLRIGVIVSNMENPYFASIMNSLEQGLRNAGYMCHFASSSIRGEEERDILFRFLDSGVDGLIIVDIGSKGENSALYAELNKRLPLIVINGTPDKRDYNTIRVDQKFGMEEVMDHFFQLGHRDILFIRDKGKGSSFATKEEVFLRRLKRDYNIDGQENIILIEDVDHFSCIEKVKEKLLPILSKKNHPTAIFLCNEVLSIGLYRVAEELGLSIPNDISIVGHDNTFLASFFHPPLTTVDMNPTRIGQETAQMMVQLLSTENPISRQVLFYPQLIIRETTKEI